MFFARVILTDVEHFRHTNIIRGAFGKFLAWSYIYLSKRFTNPIMCDIILKSYFSFMLWHKFNEHALMQTRTILL